MPLKKGYGEKTLHENIGVLVKEGKPRNQASAIAFKQGREAFFKRFPHGALPGYLRVDVRRLKHQFEGK